MSVDGKLDTIVETIGEMKIEQVSQGITLRNNTKDMRTHIKRTNILEGKVQKVWYFAMFAAGVITVKFGPEIIKMLGVLL